MAARIGDLLVVLGRKEHGVMGATSLHHLGGGLHPINDVGYAVQPSDGGVIGDLELQTALVVIDRDLLHWPAQRIAAWTNDSSQQQADRT
jgi:hypothetical protein